MEAEATIAKLKAHGSPKKGSEPEPEDAMEIGDTMFAGPGMVSAIAHANEMTMNYGVKILSINIIQAQPNDDALMMQLAQVCL